MVKLAPDDAAYVESLEQALKTTHGPVKLSKAEHERLLILGGFEVKTKAYQAVLHGPDQQDCMVAYVAMLIDWVRYPDMLYDPHQGIGAYQVY